MVRRRQLEAGALGVALTADAVAYATLGGSSNLGTARLLEGISTLCWVAGFVLLARLGLARRAVALLVLGSGLVLGLIALTPAPATSTDEYRYIWDAKVQLAGIDPYRYTPAAPELARLRDPSLFGRPDHCQAPFPGGCTSINRPTVHTIYPPVAEGAFTLVRVLSLGRGGRLPMQVAALLGSLAIGWLLMRWGGARGRPWLAAVWMWCPTVLGDLVNNAHIDWLAVLLVVLALTTPLRHRTGWAGALVGAGIATKLYPVLVLPSLMRRRPVLTVGSAVGVVALGYVPHVLAVGSAVIGYLPGYLQEEHYSSGSRLLLLGLVLPHPFDTAVGVLIVMAVVVWAWRRGDPSAPERSAVVVFGVALLVFTPNYGWYMALLVALVAMTQTWAWIPMCVAGTSAYLSTGSNARWWYLAAAVLTGVLLVLERRWTLDSLRGWTARPWISPTTDRSPSSRSTPHP